MWDQYNKADLSPALMGIKRIHREVCRAGGRAAHRVAAEAWEARKRAGHWCYAGGVSTWGGEVERMGPELEWVPDSDFGPSILFRRIDGVREDGYSQAQIPDWLPTPSRGFSHQPRAAACFCSGHYNPQFNLDIYR
jgi:hypothetical protein